MKRSALPSPPPGELTEFVTPTEDPDCAVCRMSEPERLLLLLSTADHGETTFMDEHGEHHRMVLRESGPGGIVEALASARRAAKEFDCEDGSPGAG